MIEQLHIQNYAIIDEVQLEFPRGWTIITGETGAGKSILLGALGLVMGERADTSVLYQDNEKCIVEGTFDISEYELRSFFEENELDYYEKLIMRREIVPSGRSRGFINDSPARLEQMRTLSRALIDLHQQFDTLDIHEVSFQLRMVDALAENESLLADYQEQYDRYVEVGKQLDKREDEWREARKESDFIEFQRNELEEADPREGEKEELEEELSALTHAEEIQQALSETHERLDGEEFSILEILREILHSMDSVSAYHKDCEELAERMRSVEIELEDIARESSTIAEDIEFDPVRTEEVRERLDLLQKLEEKHDVQSIDELLEVLEELREQEFQTEQLEKEIENLKREKEELTNTLHQLSDSLHEQRASVLPDLEERVSDLLSQLRMAHAQFKIDLSRKDQFGPSGRDAVAFLFAPNKGSKFFPIKKVASGGELSRLALCIKTIVASAIPLPTLVFDEIDAGISGDVAQRMGEILKELSDRHQIVTITHSPQIAACGNKHYFVHKEIEGERTFARVKLLDLEERIREIAVMLSSDPPSSSAIENAKELLEA